MSARPLLRVQGVSKGFGSSRGAWTWAVRDIGFSVPRGQFVCIVGTSGCGKSTLLGMISGLDPVSAGSIELDGMPVHGPGGDRGMVFQRDCLFPWLSVRANVGFAFRLAANPLGAAQVEKRVDALIAEVGLGDCADALPRELSGGMRQRVAIARALVTRPRLLLLDEPFGALDAQTREQMQALLLGVVREHGMTVLFVTHDVEEAVFLGDRVLVMRGRPGQVVADLAPPLPARRALSLKLVPAFARCRREVLELLQSAACPPAAAAAAADVTAVSGGPGEH